MIPTGGNPEGGDLRRRFLRERHGTLLSRPFGQHKTAPLVWQLVFWPGQTREVSAYERSCDNCNCTKEEHIGRSRSAASFAPPDDTRWHQ